MPGVAQLRLLSDALDELCSAKTDEDIVRVCGSLAQKSCGVSGISVVISGGGQFHFAPGSNPDTLSHAIRSRAITRLSEWVLEAGQTAVVPNVHQDERTRSHANENTFAHSLVVVPVGHPAPFGALSFAWSQEHWPNASEVLALEVLARATALALKQRLGHTDVEETRIESVSDWLGTAADAEGLRGLERRHWLAMADVHYRLRNTLGLVRSLIRHTAEAHDSTSTLSTRDFAANLEGRIGALARIHGLVLRDHAAGVDLQTLIESELTANDVRPRVQWAGPDVRLRAKAAETLGLALHELIINTIRHGALATNQGQVTITWTREVDRDAPCVRFDWVETRLPETPVPVHRGFGRDLIERTVPYELRGATQLLFEQDVVRCIIDIPLTPDVIVLTTAAE